MKVLRRLLKFAAPYWPRYLVAAALVFAISGLNLLEPVVIKWVIDEILESKNYALLLYGALAILGVAIIEAHSSISSASACPGQDKKWCSTYATLCTATFSSCHSVSTTKPKRAR